MAKTPTTVGISDSRKQWKITKAAIVKIEEAKLGLPFYESCL